MKKFTALLLLLFTCLCINAQTIIFQEKFDEIPSYSIPGWPYEFSGLVPWQCGLPYSVGPCMQPLGAAMSENSGLNKVACFCECGVPDPYDTNVFISTPSINMSSDTGVWLKYDSYFIGYGYFGDTEKATVEISTDTGHTWTVIEHVAPSSPIGLFDAHYINLHAYNNAPNVRIGFRYNDGGGHMMGWAIDNIMVYTPAHKDIALTAVTPQDTLLSYLATGTAFNHKMTIFNAGLDTITSFSLNYQQDAGAIQTCTFTGLSIPAFSSSTFTHTVPDTVFTTGYHTVKVWATLGSDSNIHNDSLTTGLNGVNFIPSKRLALESGEGTYNGWSPRNIYYFHMVPLLDVPATLISIHEADPMVDTVYHDFMFNLSWNYVPYILFDRRKSIPLDSFFIYLNAQKQYFGFADLLLTASTDGSNVTVNTTVIPALDMHGDYRLALILTEDGVTGPSPDYDQVNNYAGNAHGPMGGYESMGNPIPASSIVYNNVARVAAPSPDGVPGMLPAALTAGTSYNCSITTTVNTAWNFNNLRAKVLLIRHDDSTVLNSNEIAWPLALQNINTPLINVNLYPNPAADQSHLYFELYQPGDVHITISDLAGRIVYSYPAAQYNKGNNIVVLPVEQMADGLYIVDISMEGAHKGLKLEVRH